MKDEDLGVLGDTGVENVSCLDRYGRPVKHVVEATESVGEAGDIYEPIYYVGGAHGNDFSACGTASDGKVLKRIDVWAVDFCIKAIRVTLSGDGPAQMIGNPPSGDDKTAKSQSFEFEPGERITELTLWGNGAGTRFGWMKFSTNRGRTFDFGMTEWGKKTPYPVINLGSGICLGFKGKAGSDIDKLGFVMLKPFFGCQLTGVNYPTLDLDALGIRVETVDKFAASCPPGEENDRIMWEFAGTREMTESSTWSIGAGIEVYGEVSVSAGVPEVVEAAGKFGWKISATASYSRTSTRMHSLSWKLSGELDPGESISLVAQAGTGTLSIPYAGKMVITLKEKDINGQFRTFAYDVDGVYAGVAYSDIRVTDNSNPNGKDWLQALGQKAITVEKVGDNG